VYPDAGKGVVVPNQARRLPKKGSLFTLVRVAGLLMKVAGLLLSGIGVIGFIIMLVRIGPGLVDAVQHLDQQFAGFLFILLLVNLLIFPFIGLVGVAIAGIGLVLGYLGTEPAASTSIIRPDHVQMSQHKLPPTKGAG
jgi:cytochrome b561